MARIAGKGQGMARLKKDDRWERIRTQALEYAASGKYRYWHPIEVDLCKTFDASEVRSAFDSGLRTQLDVACKASWAK